MTAGSQAFGFSESTLWNFGNGPDVAGPGKLVFDSSGNLYGTTGGGGSLGGGTAFELSPPSTPGGAWTEAILWSFGNGTDGAQPSGGVIMDESGNLYGTTVGGGAFGKGTAFKLSPPSLSGGSWTESILWNFNGADGQSPNGALIMDSSANLYGTTRCGGLSGDCFSASGGTAFELSPPSTIGGNWSEAVLWEFGSGTDGGEPLSGVMLDGSGNLYGTTWGGGAFGGGTVFELSPPAMMGGNWTELILWSFGNGTDGAGLWSGLIMDSQGNLFGSTAQGGSGSGLGGTVFELRPPSTIGGSWTESILWNFGNGNDGAGLSWGDGVIMDNSGILYGATHYGGAWTNPRDGEGFGTVFELTPPAAAGGNWTESILWNFHGTDGGNPGGGLILDTNANIYGTTNGGVYGGQTVFEISPTPDLAATTLRSSRAMLNFGNIRLKKTSGPKKVKLTNLGTANAQVFNVTATAPFKIAGVKNTCLGQQIAPKKSCSFLVEFAPTFRQNATKGSIDVNYNGTAPPIAVVGNGVP